MLGWQFNMADSFYLRPTDPAFVKHKGSFPLAGAEQALQDYETYVVKEGRSVPKDLWMGTALQESGLGKYEWGGYRGGIGKKKYNTPVAARNPQVGNMMMAVPPLNYLERQVDRFAPNWRSTLNPENLLDRSREKLDAFRQLPESMRPYKDISEATKAVINAHKDKSAWLGMMARGLYEDSDYAAHKLDEGMKKFGTAEKASRWYNYYDKVPRERLPGLGRDVLATPEVQEIMKRLQSNASD